MPHVSSNSGIRDNHSRGSVGDFLRQHLKAGADLDLVTAYFTIFAYDKLRTELNQLGKIRLLFGEAAFIKNIDPDLKQGAAYVLNDAVSFGGASYIALAANSNSQPPSANWSLIAAQGAAGAAGAGGATGPTGAAGPAGDRKSVV